jgi:hypothetical protein
MEGQQGNGIDNRDWSLDGDSNVRDRNLLHFAKVNWEMVSTEFGIQIVLIGHSANADLSISLSFDCDSKVILSSEVQREKQL